MHRGMVMRMGSKGLMIKQYFKVACSAGLNYTDEFLVKQVKTIEMLNNRTSVFLFCPNHFQIQNHSYYVFFNVSNVISNASKLSLSQHISCSDGGEHHVVPVHEHCWGAHPLPQWGRQAAGEHYHHHHIIINIIIAIIIFIVIIIIIVITVLITFYPREVSSRLSSWTSFSSWLG